MRDTRNPAIWSIVVLATLFFAGAWEVMIAPLTTGDVYPPYSSLRTDPLGAKALFESLSEQPGLGVARLYKERPVLDASTTLLILGVNSIGWSAGPAVVLDQYERLLNSGGRVVIAFLPARPSGTPPAADALREQWHIRFRYREAPEQAKADAGAMPRESALYFEPGPEWRVLAESEGRATVVERNLKGGTVVLVGDSFPLSNQGLSETGDGALVTHLVGPARRVLFDENQFGVSETGSVAVLIRKYHLEAALGVLLAAAGLFVWRAASPFLPPREKRDASRVSGRDAHEGLAALLRRNIPENQLLNACWTEWRRSGSRSRAAGHRTEQVVAKIGIEIGHENKTGDPVAGYRTVCRLLTERK